jgi:hypothetical protein
VELNNVNFDAHGPRGMEVIGGENWAGCKDFVLHASRCARRSQSRVIAALM